VMSAQNTTSSIPSHVQGLRVQIDDREFILDRHTLEKSETFASLVASTPNDVKIPEVRLQRNVELFNQALSFMRGLSVVPSPPLLDELRFLGVSEDSLPSHVVVKRKGDLKMALKEDVVGTCEQLADLRENESVKIVVGVEEIKRGADNDLVFVIETVGACKDTWQPFRPPRWSRETKSSLAFYHFSQMKNVTKPWTERVEGPARVALHIVRWEEDGSDTTLQIKRFFPAESNKYGSWKFLRAFQPITSRSFTIPFTVKVEVQMQIAYDSLGTECD